MRARSRRRTALRLAAGFVLGCLLAFGVTRGSNAFGPLAPEPLAGAADAAEGRRARCVDPPAVAALAERVRRTEALASELLAANLTARFLPPKDLPARFGGKAVEDTVYASIGAAGVDAELIGTDCSEYPCLVIGRAHSAADMQRIKDQFFDQPGYSGDIKQLARGRGESPTEYRFGAMVYASTDPRQTEIRAALTRRLGVARLGPGATEPFRRLGAPSTIGADQP